MRYQSRRLPNPPTFHRAFPEGADSGKFSGPGVGELFSDLSQQEQAQTAPLPRAMEDTRPASVGPTDPSRGGADEPGVSSKPPPYATFTVTNYSQDRAYNVSTAGTVELGRVLATLIRDLARQNIVLFEEV